MRNKKSELTTSQRTAPVDVRDTNAILTRKHEEIRKVESPPECIGE
jgi:hypothetical protein